LKNGVFEKASLVEEENSAVSGSPEGQVYFG
jgi:hypothetical protein